MDYVYAVINEIERKLERTIRDLDDVRLIMDTLKKIREQEVDMELKIDPVEVNFCNVIFSNIQLLFDYRKLSVCLVDTTSLWNVKSQNKLIIFGTLGRNCFKEY